MSRPAAASDAQRFSFSTALRAYLARSRMSQEELRRRLAVDGITASQTTVSGWVSGSSPPPNTVVEAMESHLDLVPGVLTRHLGWLPLSAMDLSPDVETAILCDELLTPDQREVLLATYRALITVNRQPRPEPVAELHKGE